MIAFGKYHGLGNDFIVVDLRGDVADAKPMQDLAVARALCDRQFGIGGDGVLAILPPAATASDARMRVLNSDGSEAEMCGNGLRCVVKYLYERGGIRKDRITVDTGNGPLACQVHATDDVVDAVTVDMGTPRFTRKDIPVAGPGDERCVDVPFSIAGRDLRLTAVSTGNPHAVFFVDDDLMKLATTIGPSIETHAMFPNKTNVELARVKSRKELDLVVWERGCGITLACGTGACATTVAACVTDRATVDTEVTVNLPGGSLIIRVAPDYRTVYMRGPATHVFDGTVDPRAVPPRPRR